MAAGGKGSSTLALVDKIQMGVVMGVMDRSTLYDNVKSVKVEVEGTLEEVEIDPVRGPVEEFPDGSKRPVNCELLLCKPNAAGSRQPTYAQSHRCWMERSATEQEILVNIVAKRNRRARERGPKAYALPDFLLKDFKTVGNVQGMAWEEWDKTRRDNFVFNMMNNFDKDPEVLEMEQKEERLKRKEEELAAAKAAEASGPSWSQQDWGWMPQVDVSKLTRGGSDEKPTSKKK